MPVRHTSNILEKNLLFVLIFVYRQTRFLTSNPLQVCDSLSLFLDSRANFVVSCQKLISFIEMDVQTRVEVPREIVLSRPDLPTLPAGKEDRGLTARMVTLYHQLRNLTDDALALRTSRC